MIAFSLIGVLCLVASIVWLHGILSIGVALFGFSSLWGIHEVATQEERVRKGWFPANPARVARTQKEHNRDYEYNGQTEIKYN